MCKLFLLVSDGSSQLQAHPCDAEGWETIPQGTLCSQGGINLGDIHFCPILHTLHMQCISLDSLCTLLSEGAFMPLQSSTPPKLSRTTAILLVFQVDSEHKRIINVYVGLMVHRVNSHLYSPSQINDFIQNIDVDLQEVHNVLKARRDTGKRHAYCLFVDNLSSIMSIPTDPPYCLVYPTTYVKGTEPDHFDTQNSPVGHTCTIVYAEPPCSSATLIPSSALNMQGVTSSYPVGHSTMTDCIPLSWSHGTTAAH